PGCRNPLRLLRFEERLHSSLEYLRPVDYYLGNAQALLGERKRKLREVAVSRKFCGVMSRGNNRTLETE
ncbi:hypothetical protein M1N93_01855, partial [Dehalococcoidia bacterium]|nr:hypothetical protein [Dehalococcoidia bacterium]